MSSDDLDLGKPGGPVASPDAAAIANAKTEARTGGAKLAKSGFYVAMARESAGGRVAPHNGERHVILVVEDDADLANLVRDVLSSEGLATRFAKNRAEINAEFNQKTLPDLVLLDVSLPDANGFEILERIRGHPKIAKTPVVMVTGKSEVADVARGLSLGADGYVTKPFKIAALVSAVQTVLGLGG